MPFSQEPQDDVLTSRRASPLGKLIEEFSTAVDDETARLFRIHCEEHYTNPSHQLRQFIYWTVHGRTFDEMEKEAEQHKADARAAAFSPPAPIDRVNPPGKVGISGSVVQP